MYGGYDDSEPLGDDAFNYELPSAKETKKKKKKEKKKKERKTMAEKVQERVQARLAKHREETGRVAVTTSAPATAATPTSTATADASAVSLAPTTPATPLEYSEDSADATQTGSARSDMTGRLPPGHSPGQLNHSDSFHLSDDDFVAGGYAAKSLAAKRAAREKEKDVEAAAGGARSSTAFRTSALSSISAGSEGGGPESNEAGEDLAGTGNVRIGSVEGADLADTHNRLAEAVGGARTPPDAASGQAAPKADAESPKPASDSIFAQYKAMLEEPIAVEAPEPSPEAHSESTAYSDDGFDDEGDNTAGQNTHAEDEKSEMEKAAEEEAERKLAAERAAEAAAAEAAAQRLEEQRAAEARDLARQEAERLELQRLEEERRERERQEAAEAAKEAARQEAEAAKAAEQQQREREELAKRSAATSRAEAQPASLGRDSDAPSDSDDVPPRPPSASSTSQDGKAAASESASVPASLAQVYGDGGVALTYSTSSEAEEAEKRAFFAAVARRSASGTTLHGGIAARELPPRVPVGGASSDSAPGTPVAALGQSIGSASTSSPPPPPPGTPPAHAIGGAYPHPAMSTAASPGTVVTSSVVGPTGYDQVASGVVQPERTAVATALEPASSVDSVRPPPPPPSMGENMSLPPAGSVTISAELAASALALALQAAGQSDNSIPRISSDREPERRGRNGKRGVRGARRRRDSDGGSSVARSRSGSVASRTSRTSRASKGSRVSRSSAAQRRRSRSLSMPKDDAPPVPVRSTRRAVSGRKPARKPRAAAARSARLATGRGRRGGAQLRDASPERPATAPSPRDRKKTQSSSERPVARASPQRYSERPAGQPGTARTDDDVSESDAPPPPPAESQPRRAWVDSEARDVDREDVAHRSPAKAGLVPARHRSSESPRLRRRIQELEDEVDALNRGLEMRTAALRAAEREAADALAQVARKVAQEDDDGPGGETTSPSKALFEAIQELRAAGLTEGSPPDAALEGIRREVAAQEAIIKGYHSDNERLTAELRSLREGEAAASATVARQNVRMSIELNTLRNAAAAGSAPGRGEELRRELDAEATIAALKEELQAAQRSAHELRFERDQVRKDKRELEAKFAGVDMKAVAEESEEVRRLRRQVESLQIDHEAETAALHRRLRWYAENQESITKDEAVIRELRGRIRELEQQLDESTASARAASGRKGGRSAADVTRIATLEAQLREAEEALQKRHPDSISNLIRATRPETEVEKRVVELEQQVAQLQQAATEREADFEKRSRALRQEHEKVRAQYEARETSLKEQLVDARARQAKDGAGGDLAADNTRLSTRVAELEKELKHVREFYTKKLKESGSRGRAAASATPRDPSPTVQPGGGRARSDAEAEVRLLRREVERLQAVVDSAGGTATSDDDDSKRPVTAAKKSRRKRLSASPTKLRKSDAQNKAYVASLVAEIASLRAKLSSRGAARASESEEDDGEALKDALSRLKESETVREQLLAALSSVGGGGEVGNDERARSRSVSGQQSSRGGSGQAGGDTDEEVDGDSGHPVAGELAAATRAFDKRRRELEAALAARTAENERLNRDVDRMVGEVEGARREAMLPKTPSMAQFQSLSGVIVNLERRLEARELELSHARGDLRAAADAEMQVVRQQYEAALAAKDEEIRRFRAELDGLTALLEQLHEADLAPPAGVAGAQTIPSR